jgi:hypothetical protein
MNPRVTLGLLAILVALGGYVYFGAPGSGATAEPGATTKGAAPEQQPEIFKLDDREIARLVVRRGEQQTVVEKDADGNWFLRPSGEPADKLRLSGLVLRLSSLRATRGVTDLGNLTDFGLTSPMYTLQLATPDGSEHTLFFGAKAPAEAGTYVKRPDAPTIYVVSNALAQDVERLIAEPPVASPTPTPSPPPSPPAEPSATPGP